MWASRGEPSADVAAVVSDAVAGIDWGELAEVGLAAGGGLLAVYVMWRVVRYLLWGV